MYTDTEHDRHIRSTTAIVHREYQQDVNQTKHKPRLNIPNYGNAFEKKIGRKVASSSRRKSYVEAERHRNMFVRKTVDTNSEILSTERKSQDQKKRQRHESNKHVFSYKGRKRLTESPPANFYFQKRIETPLNADDLQLSSEDSETHVNSNPWSQRGAYFSGGQSHDTVNTALVNIYNTKNKEETFLQFSKVTIIICIHPKQLHQMFQVVVLMSVFLIQFVGGTSKSIATLNQLKNMKNLTPSQVELLY